MDEPSVEEATRARAAELFSALSHPVRLRIAERICEQSMSVGEVAAEMGIGLSGASQHLSQLARAGVLVAEAHGTTRLYRVRGPRIRKILDLIFEFCHVHRLYGSPEDGAYG
jgi:ArsR family transcriptional regulator